MTAVGHAGQLVLLALLAVAAVCTVVYASTRRPISQVLRGCKAKQQSPRTSLDEVAVGVMAGDVWDLRARVQPGPYVRARQRRRALEVQLLRTALRTWVPAAVGMRVLLLLDCQPGPNATTASTVTESAAPSWAATARDARIGSVVRWARYRSEVHVWAVLWRKTQALLRTMLHTFPRQRLLLKMDLDTLLLPSSLYQLLEACEPSALGYFGTPVRTAERLMTPLCAAPGCLVTSAAWARLERSEMARNGWVRPRVFAPGLGHAYAQGGLYGFTRDVADAMVQGPLMDEVVAAAMEHETRGCANASHPADAASPRRFCRRVAEDAAVGLSMLMLRVPLLDVGAEAGANCLYSDKQLARLLADIRVPCDLGAARPSNASIRACSAALLRRRAALPASALCPLPLGVHPLKSERLQEAWWQVLIQARATVGSR